MHYRANILTPLLCLFVCPVCLFCAAEPEPPAASCLYTPRECGRGCRGYDVTPYVPEAGDLALFDCNERRWDIIDAVALTKAPDHAGIVVARPDGRLAVLEVGPDGVPRVFVHDALERIRSYRGYVWVRRIKCPLNEEQAQNLTRFALEQEGKRYALVRFGLQITPFRARGPLRSQLIGKTDMNRKRWFCSELVVAAGSAAGLFDPVAMPANTIYPRDLLTDRRYDLSGLWHEAGLWQESPPDDQSWEKALRRR